MIEIKNVTKHFDDICAVDQVSLSIREENVFGMIGTNGAGKSTMLRMMSGVIKPDSGEILIEGVPVFDNVEAKKNLFFIADEPYFFANANAEDMEAYFSRIYEKYDSTGFYAYLDKFGLDRKRRIHTFSKGMKKQLALICGICAGTKYLYCDETFDGLDPVMRQSVKSILAGEMEERGLTPVIASHNLRELEDICDHVGLLYKGGVLLSRDLADMKDNLQKVQVVFGENQDLHVLDRLEILQKDQRGSLYTLTLRGNRDEIIAFFSTMETIFFEALPLSLEEIFISETEVAGYDVKKLILG